MEREKAEPEMNKAKYCHKCGEKLIQLPPTESDTYDTQTGQKLANYHQPYCPSNKCYHTGVKHDWENFLWWLKCKKCGVKTSKDSGGDGVYC